MADDARAKRAAALEEKKKRLEALKARRAERAAASGGASATTAAASSASTATPSRGAGGNLDDYIDGLLKSDAPVVPGVEPSKPAAAVEPVSAETSTSATTEAADGEPSPKDTEGGDGKEQATTGTTTAAASAAPALAPAPARKVETFTMATQTEEEDFPPALDDEDDDEETKRKQQAEAAATAAASAGEGDGEDNDSEKGTQTMPIAQLDPSSLSETISSRPFQHFLNSASKKVEKVLGAGALAELLDDPAYDDELDEDEDDEDLAADNGAVSEDDGAGTASEGEDNGTTPKRAKMSKKRAGRLGLLGGKTSADGALDATGIIKSSQTYSCPRWTANRDLTSITWSPHKREMLVASYQSSSSAGVVDAAVRAVSPADTPSSSLIPQSSELRSDGLALVWNLAMPDRPEHIFCCGSPVLTTAFHPTETRLVIGGCHSGQVVVWDVRAGRLPVQRSAGPASGGHAHPICSMEVVESGSALLTSATDGKVNFWSLSNLREPAESLSVKTNISTLGVAPESNALVCGDESGKVHAVIPPSDKSSSSKRTVRVLDAGDDGHFGMITGLSTRVPPKNGGHLARGFLRGAPGLVLSCGVDWTTKLWAPAYTNKPILSFVCHSYDYMCDVQWSPTHPSLFATAAGNGTLGFWNLASSLDEPLSGSKGIPIKEATGGSCSDVGVLNKISWSADGRSLAVADSDRLHVLGLSEDVARPKGDEETKMMNHLKSRGFLNEE